ncbi:4,5-DOPA dioxygenase extradiol [Isoalcanivorax beigongshangi]|uniref:4,5-DOPA dioxygenase extradiol n=1 Tax=Isoalcanivorax beigongshangi TaxID=3238810 RepID=A0ABV4AHI8_9GAMM
MNPALIDLAALPHTAPLPMLFIGHGSPMNTLEDNSWTARWQQLAQALPRPAAILCISAHWETPSPQASAAHWPQTIHDFRGFPPALQQYQYPAPGAPALAQWLHQHADVTMDAGQGLDHGAWSVLARMYPHADIPVAQLSLARPFDAAAHLALGARLAPLRQRGVLLLASGNVVHNLRDRSTHTPAWAEDFEARAKQALLTRDDDALVALLTEDAAALAANPTAEHYQPLLYLLGARSVEDQVSCPTEGLDQGTLSMLSVLFQPSHS